MITINQNSEDNNDQVVLTKYQEHLLLLSMLCFIILYLFICNHILASNVLILNDFDTSSIYIYDNKYIIKKCTYNKRKNNYNLYYYDYTKNDNGNTTKNEYFQIINYNDLINNIINTYYDYSCIKYKSINEQYEILQNLIQDKDWSNEN